MLMQHHSVLLAGGLPQAESSQTMLMRFWLSSLAATFTQVMLLLEFLTSPSQFVMEFHQQNPLTLFATPSLLTPLSRSEHSVMELLTDLVHDNGGRCVPSA